MLILSTKLQNISVMSLQTGSEIAKTSNPIIDPATLDIVAYHLAGRLLKSDDIVLLASDIREISDIGFIVDSADELVHKTDIVKLHDLLKLGFGLIDKTVIDDKGTKLGRIYDYAIDPMNFKVHQLHVKRPLMKSLQDSHLTINRSQIVEINNKNIVVQSATLEKKAQPAVVSENFINPFRKPATPSTNQSVMTSTVFCPKLFLLCQS